MLMTRSTSGMWKVIARSTKPGPRSNWLCWRRSTTAFRPSSSMARRPSGVMRTGSSARYRAPVRIQRPSAVPHPPASRTLKQPSMSRWPDGVPAVIAPRPVPDSPDRRRAPTPARRAGHPTAPGRLLPRRRPRRRGPGGVRVPPRRHRRPRPLQGDGPRLRGLRRLPADGAVRGHDALDHEHGDRLRRPRPRARGEPRLRPALARRRGGILDGDLRRALRRPLRAPRRRVEDRRPCRRARVEHPGAGHGGLPARAVRPGPAGRRRRLLPGTRRA